MRAAPSFCTTPQPQCTNWKVRPHASRALQDTLVGFSNQGLLCYTQHFSKELDFLLWKTHHLFSHTMCILVYGVAYKQHPIVLSPSTFSLHSPHANTCCDNLCNPLTDACLGEYEQPTNLLQLITGFGRPFFKVEMHFQTAAMGTEFIGKVLRCGKVRLPESNLKL